MNIHALPSYKLLLLKEVHQRCVGLEVSLILLMRGTYGQDALQDILHSRVRSVPSRPARGGDHVVRVILPAIVSVQIVLRLRRSIALGIGRRTPRAVILAIRLSASGGLVSTVVVLLAHNPLYVHVRVVLLHVLSRLDLHLILRVIAVLS